MARQPAKQIGALPWRKKKQRIEILLVTSRETRRWVIPKGWPEPHLEDYNAARQEAFEEAGVAGRMKKTALGSYNYVKRESDGDFPCVVTVFGLEVEDEFKKWPERRERQRKWFSVSDAAWNVDEPELKDIILALE